MTPLVSVIVPIYNVEPYLTSCLDSVVAQAQECRLDVILIDDGSTDGSAAIAAAFAERHPYMKLVRQANGGLGHARNVGASHATGDYLAFLDSDDILPNGAYAAMLGPLLENPALDFSTGNVLRFRGEQKSTSIGHEKSHATDRPSTHVSEHLDLLWDTVAWNKLFRRRFWEDHDLTFPEGVLYEDMEMMTRCHLLARRVAVLKRVCFLWRVRTEWPPSITQRRTELRNLKDRFASIFALFETMQQYGTEQLRRAYERKVLRDMGLYVRQYDAAGEPEYRRLLDEYVNRALRLCSAESISKGMSVDRVRYWLCANGRADELSGVNDCERFHFDRCDLTVGDNRVLRSYPTLKADRCDIPAELRDVTRELTPHTCVYDIRPDGRSLRMDVHAFVPGLSPEASRALERRFYLKHLASSGRIDLEAVPWEPDAPTAMLQGLHFDGTWSRVTVTLPVDALVRQLSAGDGSAAVWEVWVDCELGGLTWSDCVRRIDVDFISRERFVDTGECRVGAYFSGQENRLSVRADPIVVRLAAGGPPVNGRSFSVVVQAGTKDGDATLVMNGQHGPEHEQRLEPGEVGGSFVVPASLLTSVLTPSGLGEWDLVVRTGSGEHRIVAPPGWLHEWAAGNRQVAGLAGSPDGYLTAFRRYGGFRVQDLSLSDLGMLRLALESTADEGSQNRTRLELVNGSSGTRLALQPVDLDGRRWHVLNLASASRWSIQTPAPLGDWRLVVRPDDNANAEYEPRIAWGVRQTLPLRCSTHGVSLNVGLGDAEEMMLRVGIDWPEDARTNVKRRRLETEFYPSTRHHPPTPLVLLTSWGGTCFNDGPRQVYEELARRTRGLDMVWAVDGSVWTPDGVAQVQMKTKAYFEALSRARYVVSNEAIRTPFVKNDGCTYIHLARGIPVKRKGADATGAARLATGVTRRLTEDARQWDVLVSGHPEATRLYRSAFDYGGTVMEVGQPRLDPLSGGDAPHRRRRVRSLLGVEESERLVLYAPTWRDTLFSGPGRYVMPGDLEMGRLLDELGNGWRLVLKNHASVEQRTGTRLDSRVIDASSYPEMTDLYLAADVLVTDYSSAVFDFAVTGKPVLLFAPDLDNYRDRVRGVYWDLETECPGPVVRSTDALLSELQNLAQVRDSWHSRYEEFRTRFCGFEDGQASTRVVEALFADWLADPGCDGELAPAGMAGTDLVAP